MRSGIGTEESFHLRSECRDVLRILEDGKALAVLVRFHAFEAFQHFVAGDFETLLCSMAIGKYGVPDGMSVEDTADVPGSCHGEMKEGLRRGPAFSFSDCGMIADLKEVRTL